MRQKNIQTALTIEGFVDSFFDNERRSPSLREIESGIGISRQTVQRYLKDMTNNHVLKYDGKTIVTKHISECVDAPLVRLKIIGSIPCGTPESEDTYDDDYIYFPKNLLYQGHHFVLKASGDSMVDAGIDDQDLVIVRRQSIAKPNQIIVALDDENRNTLKRLMYDGARYYLHPENQKYEDLYPSELKIQGVAVKVIKNLV